MISIVDKRLCCGCRACFLACPKDCISMHPDEEGFLYPIVDEKRCVGCGLCEKVCPEKKIVSKRIPQEAVAVVNNDECVRKHSSSGGFFSALAEYVIKQNGVVFGARFDEKWQVVIDCFEDLSELPRYRGAKYVQADVTDAYKRCKRFLNDGRKVLFSGTPCQIAGLKSFLKNEYDNLLTCDVVCHGCPSPLVWSRFLNEYCLARQETAEIKKIVFRDKFQGWENYNTTFEIQYGRESECVTIPYKENPFMRAFLYDLILRPSCYQCIAKSGKSGSDFTIGDCWNSKKLCPDFYSDNKGISLVYAYSNEAVAVLHALKTISFRGVSYQESVECNPCVTRVTRPPRNRKSFFAKLAEGMSVLKLIHCCTRPSFFERTRKIVRKIKKRVLS